MITRHSYVFDTKSRAQKFAGEKNKAARKYHWLIRTYQTGFIVYKVMGKPNK